MKKVFIGLPVFILSFSAMATSVETKNLVESLQTSSCEEILNVLLKNTTEMTYLSDGGHGALAEDKYENAKAVKVLLIEKCFVHGTTEIAK
jgi:hypothetical protein